MADSTVFGRLTAVMVELLTSAQAVKWDGLGSFSAKIEATKSGVSKENLLSGNFNIRELIEIEKVGTAPNIKRMRTLVPMDTWRQQNPVTP